jgi:hypothetical protein
MESNMSRNRQASVVNSAVKSTLFATSFSWWFQRPKNPALSAGFSRLWPTSYHQLKLVANKSSRRISKTAIRTKACSCSFWPIAGLLTILTSFVMNDRALGELPFESEPIHYLTAPVDDPVARLQAKLDRGEVVLNYGKQGYLPDLLRELGISPSSQMLVFSKTSFQRSKISRRTPRAVYFNDDTYVGFCQQGEVIELSTTDPQQGAIFYTLRQAEVEKPAFQRQTHDCLQCHASSKTQDVPGHLVRSVFPDAIGMPVFNAGTFTTSHESRSRPICETGAAEIGVFG